MKKFLILFIGLFALSFMPPVYANHDYICSFTQADNVCNCSWGPRGGDGWRYCDGFYNVNVTYGNTRSGCPAVGTPFSEQGGETDYFTLREQQRCEPIDGGEMCFTDYIENHSSVSLRYGTMTTGADAVVGSERGASASGENYRSTPRYSCRVADFSDTSAPGCSAQLSDTGWVNHNVRGWINNHWDNIGVTSAWGEQWYGSGQTGQRGYFEVRDGAGNVGSCQTDVIYIDTQAPWCAATTNYGWWTRDNVTAYAYASGDDRSGVSWVDGSQTLTNDGQQAYIRVRDNVGNESGCWSPPAHIDRDAPVCSATLSNTGWSNTSVSAYVSSASDDRSGVSWVSGGQTLNNNGDRAYFQVRDNVGNEGGCWSPDAHIDRDAPSLDGDAGVSYHPVRVGVYVSDNLSGIRSASYSWDNGNCWGGNGFSNGQNITPPWGLHTLYLCAEDNAGNRSTFSRQYIADNTPPTISMDGRYNSYVAGNSLPISLSTTNIYDFTIQFQDTESGLNSYQIQVIDGSGNVTENSAPFEILNGDGSRSDLSGAFSSHSNSQYTGYIRVRDSGPRTIRVTIIDVAGNVATRNFAMNIDNSPQVRVSNVGWMDFRSMSLTFTPQEDQSIGNGQYQRFSNNRNIVTGARISPNYNYTLKNDAGSSVWSRSVSGNGVLTVGSELRSVPDGQYSMNVQYSDEILGGSAVAQYTVFINNTDAPRLSSGFAKPDEANLAYNGSSNLGAQYCDDQGVQNAKTANGTKYIRCMPALKFSGFKTGKGKKDTYYIKITKLYGHSDNDIITNPDEKNMPVVISGAADGSGNKLPSLEVSRGNYIENNASAEGTALVGERVRLFGEEVVKVLPSRELPSISGAAPTFKDELGTYSAQVSGITTIASSFQNVSVNTGTGAISIPSTITSSPVSINSAGVVSIPTSGTNNASQTTATALVSGINREAEASLTSSEEAMVNEMMNSVTSVNSNVSDKRLSINSNMYRNYDPAHLRKIFAKYRNRKGLSSRQLFILDSMATQFTRNSQGQITGIKTH